jgi:hypothetical protein
VGNNSFHMPATVITLTGFMVGNLVVTAFAGEDDLVSTATQRNLESVQSIHTLACIYSKKEYDRDGKLKAKRLADVSYWRSGTSFRAKWKDGDNWCDALVQGHEAKMRSNTAGSPVKSGGLAAYDGRPLPQGDPWLDTQMMLLGDQKGDKSPRTLSDWIRVPGIKASARKDSKDGIPFVVVELILEEGGREEYWLSPAKNYLVTQTFSTAKFQTKEFSTRAEITQFLEPKPGIFFPTEVVTTQFVDGKMIKRTVGSIKQLSINMPLPPDIFSLDFVPGDAVFDHLQGKRYTVGADGRSETNIKEIPTPVSSIVPVGELTETKTEERPFAYWIFVVSFLVTGVGLLALIRRRRLRGHSTISSPGEA